MIEIQGRTHLFIQYVSIPTVCQADMVAWCLQMERQTMSECTV